MVELLLTSLGIVVPLIQGAIGHRIEQRDLALLSLYAALTETRKYLDQVSSENLHRDELKEEELAKLWFSASIPLQHFDKDLAKLCNEKQRYWADPVGWIGDPALDTSIKLDEMHKRFDVIQSSILSAFITISSQRNAPPV